MAQTTFKGIERTLIYPELDWLNEEQLKSLTVLTTCTELALDREACLIQEKRGPVNFVGIRLIDQDGNLHCFSVPYVGVKIEGAITYSPYCKEATNDAVAKIKEWASAALESDLRKRVKAGKPWHNTKVLIDDSGVFILEKILDEWNPKV